MPRRILGLKVLLVVLAVGVLVSVPVQAKNPKEKPTLDWKSSEDGFELSHQKKLPVLLVWPGTVATTAFEKKLQEDAIEVRSFVKKTKKFVVIKVKSADEPSVVANVGKLGEKSSILLVDFNGGIHHRWRGEVPGRVALVSAMNKTRGRNEQLAQLFNKAETILKKSRYAAKLKKYKDSVLLLLEAEKMGLPPESDPVKDMVSIREILDEAYREKLAEARDLERERKLAPALDKYQQMRRDFPFPERKKELDRVISRIMREMGFGRG